MCTGLMNGQDFNKIKAVYLHIPFCLQKCLYCDFASYAACSTEVMAAYTKAVCQEIKVRSSEAQYMDTQATIYFGGGTPSVLPLECLRQLVDTLKKNSFWQQPEETTIEVNPGTVDYKKLRELRALGFDRISFGVQSLQDNELRAVGRVHTARQALEAIAMAQEAGFERVSCDLMYGLPGQTLQSLRDTMVRLTDVGVEHLSVYGLILEEGTPLERLVYSGKLRLPDEDESADMYEWIQEFLRQQGFERYEISNYAKNNQYSRHNIVYWQYRPYLGFGASACGFDGRNRRTASAKIKEYILLVQQLTQSNWRSNALYELEELNPAQQLEEFMFMGLRRSAGADLEEARQRFGADVMESFGENLLPYIEKGYVIYDAEQNRLRLSEKGMAVGNRIFEIFVTE